MNLRLVALHQLTITILVKLCKKHDLPISAQIEGWLQHAEQVRASYNKEREAKNYDFDATGKKFEEILSAFSKIQLQLWGQWESHLESSPDELFLLRVLQIGFNDIVGVIRGEEKAEREKSQLYYEACLRLFTRVVDETANSNPIAKNECDFALWQQLLNHRLAALRTLIKVNKDCSLPVSMQMVDLVAEASSFYADYELTGSVIFPRFAKKVVKDIKDILKRLDKAIEALNGQLKTLFHPELPIVELHSKISSDFVALARLPRQEAKRVPERKERDPTKSLEQKRQHFDTWLRLFEWSFVDNYHDYLPRVTMATREICDTKHKLLYFELITVEALFQTAARCMLPLYSKGPVLLQEARVAHQDYSKLQASKIEISAPFIELLQKRFDNQLKQLLKIRQTLTLQLRKLLGALHVGPVSLSRLREHLAPLKNLREIRALIMRDGDVPIRRREEYEKSLQGIPEKFPEKHPGFLFAEWVTAFFKESLPEVRRVMALLLVYEGWNIVVKREKDKIEEEPEFGLRQILGIKRLLFTTKHGTFKVWLRNYMRAEAGLDKQLAVRVILEQQEDNCCFSAAAMLRKLKKLLEEAKAEVVKNESLLKDHYENDDDMLMEIFTRLIRIVTGSAYYQLGETVATASEDLLNIKLSGNYSAVAKIILGSVILKGELENMPPMSVLFFMMQTGTNWVVYHEGWRWIYAKAGKDEYDLISSQGKLHFWVGLGVMLGHQCGRMLWSGLGWHWKIIGLGSGWYFAAAAGQYGLNKLAGWCYGDSDLENAPTLHAFTGRAGYVLGGAAFFQGIDIIWPGTIVPTPEQLMRDDTLCEREWPACEKAARKILGVSSDATKADIKAAYRKFSLMSHPDKKARLEDQQFSPVGQAYKALKKTFRV